MCIRTPSLDPSCEIWLHRRAGLWRIALWRHWSVTSERPVAVTDTGIYSRGASNARRSAEIAWCRDRDAALSSPAADHGGCYLTARRRATNPTCRGAPASSNGRPCITAAAQRRLLRSHNRPVSERAPRSASGMASRAPSVKPTEGCLTRALEGGKKCPPLRFFADSVKTAARSAAIFSVPACN